MIVTLTLNPAIDHSLRVDRLIPGAVHQARTLDSLAGGKGINVAACLADWGAPVTALGLVGADNPALFEALCRDKGIVDRLLRVPGTTRTNLKIVDGLTTTDLNLPGIAMTPPSLAQVVRQVEDHAKPGALLVFSGSLPPGCPPDIYATLLAIAHQRGARVVLDTAGAPMVCALQGAVMPDVVKPNRHELELWTGRRLPSTEAVLVAARELQARGIDRVVVSLGEAGALFLEGSQALLASLPVRSALSTVGAGDAMVAGIVAAMAEDAPLEAMARLATAFATAKLDRAGAHLPGADRVRALARQVSIQALAPVGEIGR